jgi:hypothetical protein
VYCCDNFLKLLLIINRKKIISVKCDVFALITNISTTTTKPDTSIRYRKRIEMNIIRRIMERNRQKHMDYGKKRIVEGTYNDRLNKVE